MLSIFSKQIKCLNENIAAMAHPWKKKIKISPWNSIFVFFIQIDFSFFFKRTALIFLNLLAILCFHWIIRGWLFIMAQLFIIVYCHRLIIAIILQLFHRSDIYYVLSLTKKQDFNEENFIYFMLKTLIIWLCYYIHPIYMIRYL